MAGRYRVVMVDITRSTSRAQDAQERAPGHHPIGLHDYDDLRDEDIVAPEIQLKRWRPSEIMRLVIVIWAFLSAFLVQVVSKLMNPTSLAWSTAAARATSSAFSQLGPTYAKLGQMIASSPEIFPKVLSDECQDLLDDVPAFAADRVRATIEEELRYPIDELFLDFEDRPMASASIAQVHGCVLRDGRVAVVKVQRPGLRLGIDDDLRMQYRLAALVQQTEMGRTMNPMGLIEDLNRSLHEELNFLLEARSQHRFRTNISAFGDNTMVTAPEVYWDYCSPKVLCMERLNGMSLDNFKDIRARDLDPELLLRRMIKVWCEAAFVHGLFHGDVHAGNLFLLDDDRVAFLDFGLVGRLPDRLKPAMAQVLRTSALEPDWVGFVESWQEAGLLPADIGSVEDAAALVEASFGSMINQTLQEASVGKVLQNELEMVKNLGGQIDKNLMLISKQLVYFERYARELAPNWQLAQDLFLLKNVFPEEVAAKAAAEGVTFPD